MAEFIMKDLCKREGISEDFEIASAATSTEEIGSNVHYGTRNKLAQMGVPCEDRRAVQVTKADYDKYDYLIIMDDRNVRNLARIIPSDPEGKIYKLLDFSVALNDYFTVKQFTNNIVLLGHTG